MKKAAPPRPPKLSDLYYQAQATYCAPMMEDIDCEDAAPSNTDDLPV